MTAAWWAEGKARFDYLVIVPTVAEPDVLPMTAERMIRHIDGTRTLLVFAVNPMDQARASRAIARVQTVEPPASGAAVEVVSAAGPLGFAKAVNMGLRHGLLRAGGVPRTVVVVNDDALVTPGWLQGLRNALDAPTVRVIGEAPDETGQRPDRPAAAYGRIGITGPASDIVAGDQVVLMGDEARYVMHTDLDRFAADFRIRNAMNWLTTDFISGFCLAIDRECLLDLIEVRAEPRVNDPGAFGHELVGAASDSPIQEAHPDARPVLFDERFGIGGYEDNDLCVRAIRKGWRMVTAGDTFVRHLGHRTLDRHFPGQQRGMKNRLTYYDKWRNHTGKRVVACYRVGLTFAQDLHLWKASIAKATHLVDGFSVVVTRNPLDITQAWDWRLVVQALFDEDRELLEACNGADAAGTAAAVQRWIEHVVTQKLTMGGRPCDVRVQTWTADMNEREERNAAIAQAEEMGADWLFSIDHDEVVEDRVTRAQIDRCTSHPDPLVMSWDFGWLNHWDTPRLCRVDPPWANGYRSGMRGFRLWRAGGRRILSGTAIGLHCGNCPDHGTAAKRVSGIRFRHFGYLRPEDRLIKQRRYQRIDPSPDASLTGNAMGYGHLTNEEGLLMAPYVAHDGVGFTMLVHAGEDPEDVARHLDGLHGLVDRVVLVWTDEALEDPTPELAEVGALFGVEWVRHRFQGSLADCRNAGLARLREHKDCAWALVMDPDEWFSDPFGDPVSIRRMAECSAGFGFLFRFLNHRPPDTGEPPTHSENIRFLRLDTDPDPEGLMWFGGKVHEGFDEAIQAIQGHGLHPFVQVAPFVVQHRGLAKDDEAIERKLRRYTALLLDQLRADPGDTGAWTSLGLQYANEGRVEEARICYERGVACADRAYLPFRELGIYHLRMALECYEGAVDRMVPHHTYTPMALEIRDWLRQHAPPQPLLGRARHRPVTREESLDWLPDVVELINELQVIHSAPQEAPVVGEDGQARTELLASLGVVPAVPTADPMDAG